MAKWEEKDPRWIVEVRPDATNVNNWHWTEKNANHWSKSKLAELFIGLNIEADFANCEITEMLKCEGDAMVYNRKGKLYFFYEWNIEMKWNGVVKGPVVEGRITVSNVTEMVDIKDVDVVIHFENDGADSSVLGNIMRVMAPNLIQEQLSAYVKELKEDFSKDLILPTKCTQDIEMASVITELPQKWQLNEQNAAMNISDYNFFTDTCDLYYSEMFKCTAEELYRVLTVKEFVQGFTQSQCVLESKIGGEFVLFDGNVEGYFVELEPFKKIAFKWRVSPWPKDHFSDVVININQKSDCTEMELSQFKIPKEDLENTRVGWKRHYWDSIKRTFGFGAILF